MLHSIKKGFRIAPGRMSAALALLLLPLFSRPLAWLRIFGWAVPLWGDVPFFDTAALGLAALAVILLYPERIIASFRERRGAFWYFIAVMLCEAAVIWQQLYYGGTLDFLLISQFYLLLPLAGIALNRELKRLLPVYAVFLFALLACSTLCGPLERGGFPGNWNWNFSLLAGTLPACLLGVKKHRFLLSGTLLVAGLCLFSLYAPAFFPRGTLAGVAGGSVILLFSFFFQPRWRWVYTSLLGAAGAVLFLSFVLNPGSAALRDSRVQLWKGSLDFALAHAVSGVGPGRFESRIPPYRPVRYFMTPYPATLNPHPHNEFLNQLAGFGVAGAMALSLLFVLSLRNIRPRDPYGVYLGYLFFLLIIHGQFDVLLSIPLPGTLLWLTGGVLITVPQPCHVRTGHARLRMALACCAALGALVYGAADFRAGMHLRAAKTALLRKDRIMAQKEFALSSRIKTTPQGLYCAGSMYLFGLHEPRKAEELLSRLEADLGMPNYIHNCGLLARARAAQGKLDPLTLQYFERENINYPFSIINAKYHLDVLRFLMDQQQQQTEMRLNRLLQIRRIRSAEQLAKFLMSSALDDSPIQEEATP